MCVFMYTRLVLEEALPSSSWSSSSSSLVSLLRADTFDLKEAVDECEEYLVLLPTLSALARDAGLELLCTI